MLTQLIRRTATVAALLTASMAVQANVISFEGNFADDEDRFYTTFNVTADSDVTLQSWGYAGGINGAGNLIGDGGFDSQLFLFDAGGNLLEADDDDSAVVSASSGNSWDALITRFLSAGTYIAVMTQYNSDYISGDIITGNWTLSGVTNFLDVSGSQRTSAYAFDISGDFISDVDGGTVSELPEPASIVLFLSGLLMLARRRRNA